jgi:Arc/MetJ-type ribon-helix-helix transcriptional regulator
MKTIAITIDEPTLQLLDELAGAEPRRRSRSALVRAALREFAERERARAIEGHERQVFRKHRRQLAREARLLIRAQARA